MPRSEKEGAATGKAGDKQALAFSGSAAEVISSRLERIGSLSGNLLDLDDVAQAAEMDLVTRRMRVALGVFKPVFAKAQYRNALEETRVLARAVSTRHRFDVSIATAGSVAAEMSEMDAAGLEGLIRDLEKSRLEANHELGRIVQGRRMNAYRVRIEDLIGSAVGSDFEMPERYRPMRSVPPSVIKLADRRLQKLRECAPEALKPDGMKAQRRMGTAAEMLRYTLELCGEALGTQADTARRSARGLQGLLGEMSECDHILPHVRGRSLVLEAEDASVIAERARGARILDPVMVQAAPNRNSYRGLELLSIHLLASRTMAFEGFLRLWKEQARQGVWVALENLLHS